MNSQDPLSSYLSLVEWAVVTRLVVGSSPTDDVPQPEQSPKGPVALFPKGTTFVNQVAKPGLRREKTVIHKVNTLHVWITSKKQCYA